MYTAIMESDNEDDIIQVVIKENKKILYPTCAIMTIDSKTGDIIRCQKESDRRLWQLGGMWEINSEFVKNVKAEPEKLGVCKTHFNLDQNFHKSGFKSKSVKQSIITVRRCL